jgi:hypothetical protein
VSANQYHSARLLFHLIVAHQVSLPDLHLLLLVQHQAHESRCDQTDTIHLQEDWLIRVPDQTKEMAKEYSES